MGWIIAEFDFTAPGFNSLVKVQKYDPYCLLLMHGVEISIRRFTFLVESFPHEILNHIPLTRGESAPLSSLSSSPTSPSPPHSSSLSSFSSPSSRPSSSSSSSSSTFYYNSYSSSISSSCIHSFTHWQSVASFHIFLFKVSPFLSVSCFNF